MARNKTHEEFDKEISEKFNGNIKVVGKYIDKKTKIDFECNCGYTFSTTPQSILKTIYGCPKCANSFRKESQKETFKNTKEKFVDKCTCALKFWRQEENIDINIDELSWHSGTEIIWVCPDCGHKWKSSAADMSYTKFNCPNCYKKSMSHNIIIHRLQQNGSFVDSFPDLLNEWDYGKNNNIDPSSLLSKSNKKVWWKCSECGCSWESTVAHRTEGKGCPQCARTGSSNLQKLVENYIEQKYKYKILHEWECSLKCKNPQTNYLLRYDNEVIINNDIRLIIEINGQQHYEICGWHYTSSKSKGTTPEEEFKYLQYKDLIKKQYALSQGYHYLAIPYTAESNDSYKTLIDEKISSIIHNTKLLSPLKEAI